MSRYDDLSREELLVQLEARDREARRERRLGLVWERDAIDHETALNADFVVMEHDPAQSVGSAPYRHLLVEGDNFDALRFLRMTHAGQVKCICIDPPYNTGNRDFVYNDRFVDAEDSFRHSKWLEFIYRRLLLARDLLREDGVIFVNIGEDEMAHLACLMDQVFPGMKVGTLVWKTRSGANDAKEFFFSQDHEYILCYAGPRFSFQGEVKSTDAYSNPDNDPRGPWINDNLVTNKNLVERPNAFYPIQNPITGLWYACDPDNTWRFASEAKLKPGQRIRTQTMETLICADKILWPKDDTVAEYATLADLLAAIDAGIAPRNLRPDLPDLDFWIGKRIGFGKPRYKRHLSELRRAEKPLSSWVIANAAKGDDLEAQLDAASTSLRSGYTSDGTSLIQDMLGTKDFSYPKPLSLIQSLVAQATGPDDLVVDFFAGSGTTGHAVLALNAEDGGSRRFILVSNTEATAAEPEKNVCRDVTRRRLEKAVGGYTVQTRKGLKQVEGLGGGFGYLRTCRIGAGDLLDLEHEQVWIAIQLMHFGEFTPAPARSAVWMTGDELLQVVYLPRATAAAGHEVAEMAERAAETVIYTWQPEAVRQRLFFAKVRVEKIPECLAQRFGLKL